MLRGDAAPGAVVNNKLPVTVNLWRSGADLVLFGEDGGYCAPRDGHNGWPVYSLLRFSMSNNSLAAKIANKTAVVGVIGLGYVGLPLMAVAQVPVVDYEQGAASGGSGYSTAAPSGDGAYAGGGAAAPSSAQGMLFMQLQQMQEAVSYTHLTLPTKA